MKDMILGRIELLKTERDSFLDAYYKADYEREELREEVKRLKEIISSFKRRKICRKPR